MRPQQVEPNNSDLGWGSGSAGQEALLWAVKYRVADSHGDTAGWRAEEAAHMKGPTQTTVGLSVPICKTGFMKSRRDGTYKGLISVLGIQ